MSLPKPAQVIEEKLNTVAKATGQAVADLATGVKAEFAGLVSQANQGLTSASNNIRVLAEGAAAGDLQVKELTDGIADVVASTGEELGTTISGKISAATGAAVKAGIRDSLASSEGVADSQVGINSNTTPTKPAGKSTLIQNQLEQYSSVNCVFTLGALSSYSINNPEITYRQNGPDVTILRSGGGGIDDNRVQTVYDAMGGEAGNLEYFIDDVEIDAIVAPSRRSGISQATNISFTVHEPYSMGLFLQAMQAAARDAGFQNYLRAPYMLELDFIGWDDNGNSVPVEYANRKIPFSLSNIEFDVERGGSVYRISAYPWNEVALLDEFQEIRDPISISGPSVLEALTTGPNSLQSVMNDAIATAANEKGKPVSDFYVIRFPTVRTALNGLDTVPDDTEGVLLQSAETVRAALGTQAGEDANANQRGSAFNNFFSEGIGGGFGGDGSPYEKIRTSTLQDVNTIGFSPMVPLIDPQGDQPFGLGLYTFEEVETTDENGNPTTIGIYKRDGVELQISNDVRTFKFEQGTKISKIVEEMVLISEYGKSAMQAANDDKESMIPWFRIEPQVFVVDDYVIEEEEGKKARVWVFNVVPYEVASSTFVAPNQQVAVQERAKQAVKSYDYIYSGENKDVLGFDIKFNAAFFTAIQADYGEASERLDSSEGLTDQARGVAYNISGGETTGTPGESTVVRRPVVRNHTQGSYNLDAGQNLARQFHEALLNSDVDLITADLEIWGDPYYLHDSGLGNYNAPTSNTSACLTADGCADYQRGHVHILVNFRTPIDYNQDGSMYFPEDTQAVEGFSGLYRVLSVNSVIQGNQFKQTLGLIREKNQTLEGAVQARNRMAVSQDQNANSLNPDSNTPPAEEVGITRDSSVAAAGSLAAVEPLAEDGQLASVSSKGVGDVGPRTVQVAELVAPNFQGLIDDLEDTYNYEIRGMGGYVRRNAVGSQNWSYHASGLALDINPGENGIIRPRPDDAPEPTDMPEDGTGSAMEALAAKHGLGWGGAWNSLTDSMHFSAAQSEFGTLNWPRNGVIPGAPPAPPAQPTGEVAEVPNRGWTDADAARVEDLRSFNESLGGGAASSSLTAGERAYAQSRGYLGNTSSGGGRGDGAAEAARRRQDQRNVVSGTSSVTEAAARRQAAGGTASSAAAAPQYDDAILRQQRANSRTTNTQGEVTGLRPYFPINPQDDRYDFNTGDKIKAILAARNNN